MLTTLVPLTVVLATAAPETSRVQLDLFGVFGYATLSAPSISVGFPPQAVTPPDGESRMGAGGLSLTVYPQRALTDTDAPLSLQPFLERLTSLRLAASGGGFETRESAAAGFDFTRSEQQASVSAAADAYVTRHAIVGGSLGLAWSTTSDRAPNGPPLVRTTWIVPLSVALGGRFGDTRVDASWSVAPTGVGGAWQVPFWGGAGVTVQSVFQRRVDVWANAHAIERGAFGTLGVGVYPSRRFGCFGSFFGGGGLLFADATRTQERFGAGLGVSAWVSRHFGGALRYTPTWTSGPTEVVQHELRLELFSRIK